MRASKTSSGPLRPHRARASGRTRHLLAASPRRRGGRRRRRSDHDRWLGLLGGRHVFTRAKLGTYYPDQIRRQASGLPHRQARSYADLGHKSRFRRAGDLLSWSFQRSDDDAANRCRPSRLAGRPDRCWCCWAPRRWPPPNWPCRRSRYHERTPAQRPAGDQRGGPRQPHRHRAGLVPRRLEGRSAGPLGLRAPVRAPDVQEHQAHARRADGSPHRGRRRRQQRLHRRRRHQLLRGGAQQLPADPAVGRGRAAVQPQRGREELQVRARGGAGGISPERAGQSLRQAVQRDRPALVHGASVQATDHRQHRGSRRRLAAGRDRLPPDVLPPGQRHPDRRRRLRPEAARRVGRSLLRLDPEAGHAGARRSPCRSRRAAPTSATPKPAPTAPLPGAGDDLADSAGIQRRHASRCRSPPRCSSQR